MSGILLLRAGCAVLCVTMVMAAGAIAVVVAQWPLIVRAMAMAIMAVCGLAGFGLVAMGSIKIINRAEKLRRLAAAQDHDRAAQDAERA
jgi:multidrug efflux pump subunit AcrB